MNDPPIGLRRVLREVYRHELPTPKLRRSQAWAESPTYEAPTVPVVDKCGYFLVGDDIAGNTTWAARHDTLSIGAPSLTSTTQNTSGWPTPEGNRKTISLNGSTSEFRINGLAAMATANDPPLEIVVWYKLTTATNPTVILSWSSTSSATPLRALLLTTGAFRWRQQGTTNVFGHNATNTLQQMVRVCVKNNGAGTDTTIWRNEELDPIDADGTLQMNVAAQAVNTFMLGSQDAGGTVSNRMTGEIFAIWVRDPAAAPLTDAEGLELHNFMMGGYDTAPLYAGSEEYFLPFMGGQSNAPLQGIATGAVTGMPDANVKTYWRNLNNDADDPLALRALDRRPGASSYHGSAQYMPTGTFAVPHHMFGVGQGATRASDWTGSNNGSQGYYSTNLYSEIRRLIYMSKCRFGGNPFFHILWQQGESDAALGAPVAANWGSQTSTIRANIRAFLLRVWGATNVPFHIIKLSDSQNGSGITMAERDTIQAAADTLALDPDTYAYNTDSVPSDGLHFNASGYAAIAAIVIPGLKASDARL